MAEPQVTKSPSVVASGAPTSERCIMLIFGASGDLTKRLLVPALYNLACDGLLHENFAVLGTAMDAMTTEQFRAKMSEDIKKFHTRKEFEQDVWDKLIAKFHYVPGSFGDANVLTTLKSELKRLDAEHDA